MAAFNTLPIARDPKGSQFETGTPNPPLLRNYVYQEKKMKLKKGLYYLEKIINAIELAIAFLLLIVIAIKLVDLVFELTEIPIEILSMEFERILSIALTLVIGAEFIKMLCKHTPETVIDVLLFVIARQMVLYHKDTIHLIGGVAAIAGLFAVRKFLIEKKDIYMD